MTSLSDEDCPFSEYERRAQASVIDVLSPNLSQTRLFPKFTLLEQHQPYRSLAGILGGKNVGTLRIWRVYRLSGNVHTPTPTSSPANHIHSDNHCQHECPEWGIV